MTDLHTHILPQMDDGAKDTKTSLQMLRLEWQQGVRTVALTPHFYPDRENVDSFLSRRAESYGHLRAVLPKDETLPELILGAEVAFAPNMHKWKNIRQLCYENSSYLLVELPVSPWSEGVFRELFELMNFTGITPIIAHIDRYWGIVSNKHIERLLEMGVPIQLSAQSLVQWSTRRRAFRMLQEGSAHMLISDCHNVAGRAPNMEAAARFLRKKKGPQDALFFCIDE